MPCFEGGDDAGSGPSAKRRKLSQRRLPARTAIAAIRSSEFLGYAIRNPLPTRVCNWKTFVCD